MLSLQPTLAYGLLRIPLNELDGLILDLNDLVGRSVQELGGLQRARSMKERTWIVSRWVMKRIDAFVPDRRVVWASDVSVQVNF